MQRERDEQRRGGGAKRPRYGAGDILTDDEARTLAREARRAELWRRVRDQDVAWLASDEGLQPGDDELRDDELCNVLHVVACDGSVEVLAAVLNKGAAFRALVLEGDEDGCAPPLAAHRRRRVLCTLLLLRARDRVRRSGAASDAGSSGAGVDGSGGGAGGGGGDAGGAAAAGGGGGDEDDEPSMEEAGPPAAAASGGRGAGPAPPASLRFDPYSPTDHGYHFNSAGQHSDHSMLPDGTTAAEYERDFARQLRRETEEREDALKAAEAARRRDWEARRGKSDGRGEQESVAVEQEEPEVEDALARANAARQAAFRADPPAVVTLSSLPWPDLLRSGRLPLPAVAQRDKVARGKHLNVLQLFWHPDKVEQKHGARMAPGDRGAIRARVTEVAQQINARKDPR